MEKRERIEVLSPMRSAAVSMRRFSALAYNMAYGSLLVVCVGLATLFVAALEVIPPPVFFFTACPVALLAYFSFKNSGGRQSPGNRSMALIVVDENNEYLSFSKSLRRGLLCVMSFLPFGLGFAWAAFHPSGSGWHDLILKTRVARVKGPEESEESEGSDDSGIPVCASLAFFSGFFSLAFMCVPIATLLSLLSSLPFMKFSCIAAVVAAPLAFVMGIAARIMFRVKGGAAWVKNLADNGIQMSIAAGILLVLFAMTLPSNPLFYGMNKGATCERQMKEIGAAAEKFTKDRNRVPGKLYDLVKNGYLRSVPQFQYAKEYIYTIVKEDNREYFMIECPDPEELLIGRGIGPPLKCVEMKYIQGKGLVVKTDTE